MTLHPFMKWEWELLSLAEFRAKNQKSQIGPSDPFGSQKHVLHLVRGVLGISTAIETALKGALYDFFDGSPRPFE